MRQRWDGFEVDPIKINRDGYLMGRLRYAIFFFVKQSFKRVNLTGYTNASIYTWKKYALTDSKCKTRVLKLDTGRWYISCSNSSVFIFDLGPCLLGQIQASSLKPWCVRISDPARKELQSRDHLVYTQKVRGGAESHLVIDVLDGVRNPNLQEDDQKHKRTVCLSGVLMAARNIHSSPWIMMRGSHGNFRITSSFVDIWLASVANCSSLVNCAATHIPTCIIASFQPWPDCFVSMLTPMGDQERALRKVWLTTDIFVVWRGARARTPSRKRSDGSTWMTKSTILALMAVPAWPRKIRDVGSIRAVVLVDALAIDATAHITTDTPV